MGYLKCKIVTQLFWITEQHFNKYNYEWHNIFQIFSFESQTNCEVLLDIDVYAPKDLPL